ncbi:hypothetical protein SPFM12_00049 [Salmonella phage SPFM12]|nr:hypothetical protein SPFM12_00049 [Salmonella phage SPFM12]
MATEHRIAEEEPIYTEAMIIILTSSFNGDMDEDLYMHLSGTMEMQISKETLLQIAESTPFVRINTDPYIHEQGSWMERRRWTLLAIQMMSRGLGVSTEPVVPQPDGTMKAIGFPIAEQECIPVNGQKIIEFPDEHRGQLQVDNVVPFKPKVVVATDEPPFGYQSHEKISAPVAI